MHLFAEFLTLQQVKPGLVFVVTRSLDVILRLGRRPRDDVPGLEGLEFYGVGAGAGSRGNHFQRAIEVAIVINPGFRDDKTRMSGSNRHIFRQCNNVHVNLAAGSNELDRSRSTPRRMSAAVASRNSS